MQRALEARSVRIDNIRRLTGGASRETWSLDAAIEHADGRIEDVPLILQRDVRGAPKELSRAQEFALMRAACDNGVPAPQPFLFGDDSLGGEFFLVRRVEGETLPRRLLREDVYAEARRALPAQLGHALANIHAIPLDAPGIAPLPTPPDGVSPAAYELDRYEQIFRGIALEPHPVFELTFRWLRSRLPASNPTDRKLVHGDYRIGNVLFGPEGMRLVLDWEIAHAGDPMEDMGFLCIRSWRFGGDKPVGGVGTYEEFFEAYEAAGGDRVDPERQRWWEVFGNVRWGVICLSQARVYIDGRSTSVELASIGRRTAETEWELLSLID